MASDRSWFLFSSSSGETLRALFKGLSKKDRDLCLGVCCDRECGSAAAAREFLDQSRVHVWTKDSFEAQSLKLLNAASMQNPMVLLCGFFGIFSESYLDAVPSVFVNTHPSLLPAFSGLDKRVHREAYETASVSGFTLHLVTKVVDGGPILFQHPVWINPEGTWEDLRSDVRRAEQHYLPLVWSRLLQSSLSKKDLLCKSVDLRARLGLGPATFKDRQ